MEKKWIYVYGWLSAFTVHLKLSQHGLLITYTPIKSKKSKQKKKKKKDAWNSTVFPKNEPK